LTKPCILTFARFVRCSLIAVIGFLALSGCGGGSGAAISGSVSLDGAPLDEATITFVPEDGGQRQAAWAPVVGGKYAIDSSSGLGSGKFRVEIRAVRSSGDKANPNEPTLMTAKDIVPAKYNDKSELTVEIKPGKNSADFAVTSK
jgi:hypothetical protein